MHLQWVEYPDGKLQHFIVDVTSVCPENSSVRQNYAKFFISCHFHTKVLSQPKQKPLPGVINAETQQLDVDLGPAPSHVHTFISNIIQINTHIHFKHIHTNKHIHFKHIHTNKHICFKHIHTNKHTFQTHSYKSTHTFISNTFIQINAHIHFKHIHKKTLCQTSNVYFLKLSPFQYSINS